MYINVKNAIDNKVSEFGRKGQRFNLSISREKQQACTYSWHRVYFFYCFTLYSACDKNGTKSKVVGRHVAYCTINLQVRVK